MNFKHRSYWLYGWGWQARREKRATAPSPLRSKLPTQPRSAFALRSAKRIRGARYRA